MERYKRVTGRLREYSFPDEANRRVSSRINNHIDAITDAVTGEVTATDRPHGGVSFLFGWIDMLWLRRSLAIVSIALLLIFVVQHTILLKRVGLIEERITATTTSNILEYQKVIQSVVYEELETSGLKETDSVKVSIRDLGKLISSYRELQYRYGRLKVMPEGGIEVPGSNPEKMPAPLSN
ncbi:MAG: hypothetical protein LC649_01255 [Bacteroidales bacterium]|nr:hypothetical protein [Bacteroidales bacterium]